MATELRDSLVKLYLEMPYKNSLNLSPALQKLQQQFNNTWSAINQTEMVVQKQKEETVVPRWKLNKSVISKVDLKK